MDNRTKTALTSGAFKTQRSQYAGKVEQPHILLDVPQNMSTLRGEFEVTSDLILEAVLPDSVEMIEINGAEKCRKLIANGATEIEAPGMISCEEIEISNAEVIHTLYHLAKNSQKTVTVNLEKARIVQGGAFDGANAIIYLNDDVEEVEEGAFYNAKHLYYHGDLEGAPWGAQAWN